MLSDEHKIQFLLKEYDQLWEQARHLDEHLERVPRFFLIVVGAAATVLAALTQIITPSKQVFVLAGIGLLVLGLIGFVASLTIVRFRAIRNQYFGATYLIRGYFADYAPDVVAYLWFPTRGTFEDYIGVLRNDFFRFLMMVLMDVTLVGVGVYFTIFAPVPPEVTSPQGLRALVGIEAGVIVIFALIHVAMYFLMVFHFHRQDLMKSNRLQSLRAQKQ